MKEWQSQSCCVSPYWERQEKLSLAKAVSGTGQGKALHCLLVGQREEQGSFAEQKEKISNSKLKAG